LLKFFRINHRDEQIREQREGNEADNDVFHKSLEFFAPVGVDLARHKKQGDDGDENDVSHKFCIPDYERAGQGFLFNPLDQPLLVNNQLHSLDHTSHE
jgi:hypothetical protein